MIENAIPGQASTAAAAPSGYFLRNWHVAETLPRKERVAQSNLERQAFRSFCPRFRKTRRHARREDTVFAPLFPGYVFVAFDKARDSWHSINGTHGVKRLVGSPRGEPAAMPVHVMEALFSRCDGEHVTRILPELHTGQKVRLVRGPFVDRVAQIERLDDRGRVRLLLDILGSRHAITVSSDQVGLA